MMLIKRMSTGLYRVTLNNSTWLIKDTKDRTCYDLYRWSYWLEAGDVDDYFLAPTLKMAVCGTIERNTYFN